MHLDNLVLMPTLSILIALCDRNVDCLQALTCQLLQRT